MVKHAALLVGLVLTVAEAPPSALAQRPPDPAALLAAQSDSMLRLAFMDGAWRGTARTLLPSGEKREVTQTERVGPFLGARSG